MSHDPTRAGHDPADCPVCDEAMTRTPVWASPTQADLLADDYYERLSRVADERFR